MLGNDIGRVQPITIQVTDKEKKLIDYIRKLKHGEFVLQVRESEPTRVVQPKESILL